MPHPAFLWSQASSETENYVIVLGNLGRFNSRFRHTNDRGLPSPPHDPALNQSSSPIIFDMTIFRVTQFIDEVLLTNSLNSCEGKC
jgi:hypothetical protein